MAVEFLFTDSEKELFKRLSVDALILFGSRARDYAGNARSDFDIGIIVSDKAILYDYRRRSEIYMNVYDVVSSHINQIVNIDIVFLEDAPGELQSHVLKYGQPIYESSKNIFADFKERIFGLYADFAPLREIFQEGVLARIK